MAGRSDREATPKIFCDGRRPMAVSRHAFLAPTDRSPNAEQAGISSAIPGTMNAKRTRFSVALIISFVGAFAFAANEVIPLRPLDVPAITKWVPPTSLPAGDEDATVMVSFILKTTGEPADIRVVSPRDAALEKCLLPALAQCRFTPVIKNGVAVDTKVMLPMMFNRWDEEAKASIQVGAVSAAAPVDQLAAAAQDENTHPAMFHLNAITRGGKMIVADGADETAVRSALGQPEQLSATVWAFAKFSGQSAEANRHGCDTLLVSFEDQRVVALALVNELGQWHVAEQLKFNPNYVASRLSDLHQATALASK